MHGRWYHQKHYQKNTVVAPTDGVNAVNALGSNPRRRGLLISVFSVNSGAAKFVSLLFGVLVGAPPGTPWEDMRINTTLGTYVLDYDTFGEILEAPISVFANQVGFVWVTEIIDSSPECECYAN